MYMSRPDTLLESAGGWFVLSMHQLSACLPVCFWNWSLREVSSIVAPCQRGMCSAVSEAWLLTSYNSISHLFQDFVDLGHVLQRLIVVCAVWSDLRRGEWRRQVWMSMRDIFLVMFRTSIVIARTSTEVGPHSSSPLHRP